MFQLMRVALCSQIDQRASAIATNLSNAAAGHGAGKNALELDALVSRYGRLEGAAYAFIENGKGKIVADSLGIFPPVLREPLSFGDRREAYRRELEFQGKTVYETRPPILKGQGGAVHVGFWGGAVETEIQSTLFPLVGLITFVFIVGMLLSVYLARIMVQRILRLTESAEKIDRGNLEIAVGIDSYDEIGNLGHSIERLRASLKTAMSRLTSSRNQ